MKKIKLITSLTTLGLVATATPIMATSCSSNNLTNLKVYGGAFPEKIVYTEGEATESISINDFGATLNGKAATLKTLTIASSKDTVIQPNKTPNKEEYTFVLGTAGNATLTVTLEDDQKHTASGQVGITVEAVPTDTTVSSVKIGSTSVTDIFVDKNYTSSTELGQIVAIPYNAAGQALTDKTVSFEVKQGEAGNTRPDWIGNISVANNTGAITAVKGTTEPTTVQSWTTTYVATCEGKNSPAYPLNVYWIPPYTENGIIYDDNGTPTVLNFENEKLTTADLNTLSGESDTVTIAGTTVDRDKILSVGLYELDPSVDAIPDNFLYGFTNLIYIDSTNASMSQIKTIGKYFLHYCRSITEVDLSLFTGLDMADSIGQGAFNCCDSLVNINIGSIYSMAFDADDGYYYYSFATDNNEAPCYVTGITLTGEHAADVKTRFPEYSSRWGIYRAWAA